MSEQPEALVATQRRPRSFDPGGSGRGALLGKLVIAVMIPIVLYSLSVLAERFVQTYRLRQDAAFLRAEVEYEKQENLRLQQELNAARGDQAIEDAARRHLNLVKPGDNPIVLNGVPPPPTPVPAAARGPSRSEQTDGLLEWVSWVLTRLGR